jgi:ribonuclease HI
MMKKQKSNKFYVVWKGRQTGVYENWDECFAQISQYPDAKYMSFKTLQEANTAFKSKFEKYIYKKTIIQQKKIGKIPDIQCVCVDAACSVEKQLMEYRGVILPQKKVIFHKGPFEGATNNIGEFLALVHAMAFMKKHHMNLPVYSDSNTAMVWVKNKKIKTTIEVGEKVQILIDKALLWLEQNNQQYSILKWETAEWGEIPADFGRK